MTTYLMGQCDLEGADSWTVAAECTALGDPTMLADLRAGLKPAKILCMLYLHGPVVNTWDRAAIKAKLKETAMPDWLYPGAKSAVHGSSYGMGIPTMIGTVLKFSMADLPLELGTAKPIVLTTEQAKRLQEAFFSRYPGVKRWHAHEARSLLTQGFITTSVGHLRRFYGRKAVWKKGLKLADHETLKEALSSKPQFWTTHVCKRALLNLWLDPWNRLDDGTLKVEPLIAVHDSILFQFEASLLDAVKARLPIWFAVTSEIAGQQINIPFAAEFSGDWGMKEKL